MKTYEITFIDQKLGYQKGTVEATDKIEAVRIFKVQHKKCKLYRIVEKE